MSTEYETNKAFEGLRDALAAAERFLVDQNYATHASVTCGAGFLLFAKSGDRCRLQYISGECDAVALTECSAAIRIAAGLRLGALKTRLDEAHALLLQNLAASRAAATSALADWTAPHAAPRDQP